MTQTYEMAWKENLIYQVGMGRPLALSARIMRIGMDRIIFEKERDPDFAKRLAEAEENSLKQVQY